jgi:chemosensory pili system protein ChpA (sensor histidine kinase/response regulator)
MRNREGIRCGILTESIIASEEQIVKPLNKSTLKIPGVIGASILGDGRVSAVMDVYELPKFVQAYLVDAKGLSLLTQQADTIQAKPERFKVLVVDDSLSARRSLAQFMEDAGFEVFTAKDGLEAIDSIQRQMPHLILADLEMPRMNGLELTGHLRSREDTMSLPIVMITSRATEKHRAIADRVGVTAYLNKPWSEEDLFNIIQPLVAKAS